MWISLIIISEPDEGGDLYELITLHGINNTLWS